MQAIVVVMQDVAAAVQVALLFAHATAVTTQALIDSNYNPKPSRRRQKQGKDQDKDCRFNTIIKRNLSKFCLNDPMIIGQW